MSTVDDPEDGGQLSELQTLLVRAKAADKAGHLAESAGLWLGLLERLQALVAGGHEQFVPTQLARP